MTKYNQLAILFREIIGVKYLDYRDAYFAIAQILLSIGAWPVLFFTMKRIINPSSKVFVNERVVQKNPAKLGLKHIFIYGFSISVIFGVFFFASFMKRGYEMLWVDWYLRFIFVGFAVINLSLWISTLGENKQKISAIIKTFFIVITIPYIYVDSMISVGVFVPLWVRKATGWLFYLALPANCAYTRWLTKEKILFYIVTGLFFFMIVMRKWKTEQKERRTFEGR